MVVEGHYTQTQVNWTTVSFWNPFGGKGRVFHAANVWECSQDLCENFFQPNQLVRSQGRASASTGRDSDCMGTVLILAAASRDSAW